MKKILAFALAVSLILTGCGQPLTSTPTTDAVLPAAEEKAAEDDTPDAPTATDIIAAPETEETVQAEETESTSNIPESSMDNTAAENTEEADAENVVFTEPEYSNFTEPGFLQYVTDRVYAGLADEFDSEDYIIEGVDAVYVSQEYLEEVAYNSKANIFFGYTLEEIEAAYNGSKYIFTLGEDGTTVVEPFEDYDDTYEKVVKNVAVGTGVILICVTVSIATGGAGLTPVSLIFAASAKTATTFALSSGAMGAISAGLIEGIRTQDFQAALKAAALAGSNSFKWGAITGTFIGGAQELGAITRAGKAVEGATEAAKGTVEIPEDAPLWRQAELRALNEQGGYEQVSYLNGKQVELGTLGSTRPDVVRLYTDHIEAVEVKAYNLEDESCVNVLLKELKREVSDRNINLPDGSTQRIILDVTGRGYSSAVCEAVKNRILNALGDIYSNIPIEIVGLA